MYALMVQLSMIILMLAAPSTKLIPIGVHGTIQMNSYLRKCAVFVVVVLLVGTSKKIRVKTKEEKKNKRIPFSVLTQILTMIKMN